jgi:hypothetical protein
LLWRELIESIAVAANDVPAARERDGAGDGAGLDGAGLVGRGVAGRGVDVVGAGDPAGWSFSAVVDSAGTS